ncbi:MAG: DUF1549 and DUF1553 domain-containing protein, partial [Planctomycetota bacterium]
MKRTLTFVVAFWFVSDCTWSVRAHADEGALSENPIEDYEREHWSFRPIDSPAIPRQKKGRPASTVDAFVFAEQEKRGLVPAPPAGRSPLLRRVTIDLTGLPPTPGEINSFLVDDHPDAYVRVVDRLLASPQYGQRWGQFWLDLARFAETDGFEHDKVRDTAWQYRDWVVDALNEDLGYDQFVEWQIAGDILAPNDPDAKLATAFCLSGPDMPDINSQIERKHVLLNEITSTVGAVFLSLQIGCAQCHDHKYDPISQADFYRLRAYFESAIKLKANKSVAVLSANAADATPRMYARGDWKSPADEVSASTPRIVTTDRPSNGREHLARWLSDAKNPLVARSIVNRVWQRHFGTGLSSTPSDFGFIGDEPSHPELLDHLASELIRHDWSLKWLHREILLSSVFRTTSLRPAEHQHAKDWELSRQSD